MEERERNIPKTNTGHSSYMRMGSLYVLRLADAAQTGAHIDQYFIYDPRVGPSPDCFEVIRFLRSKRVNVFTVPMSRSEREHWDIGDIVFWCGRYIMELPLENEGEAEIPTALKLRLHSLPESKVYLPYYYNYLERLQKGADEYPLPLPYLDENGKALNSIIRGVFRNLDEAEAEKEYFDWTTKKITILGDDTEEKTRVVKEALTIVFQVQGVNVSSENLLTDLEKADIIISIMAPGQMPGEFWSDMRKNGMVKNGVLFIEVQLENPGPKQLPTSNVGK